MLPAKKTSKGRTRTRRAHHALTPINVVKDPATGEMRLPHRATPTGEHAHLGQKKKS